MGSPIYVYVDEGLHKEIADSSTADSAIMALERMGCRRGYPSHIYSDNGTNLPGAGNEWRKSMKELDGTNFQDFATNQSKKESKRGGSIYSLARS